MKYKVIFILITILAFVLRFWQLGTNPPSLDWDEASLGYNAYSILKTGRDEYGNFLPLSIRSFGDYKPPLYTYLTIIPVALFGLTEFSTRLISALLGSLTVVVAFFLFRRLFPNKSNILYFIFYILFSLSPWHLQFSRVAFEANIALFFFISGLWLFLKAQEKNLFFIFSFFSFSLSLYAYHSPRLVVPVFLVGLFFLYRDFIKKNLKIFLIGLILFVLMLTPIVWEMRSTGARFGSVTIINNDERLSSSIGQQKTDKENGDLLGFLMHNRRIIYTREVLAGYLDHFNFDFLFLTGDSAGRHHAFGMGMLYIWELLFILIGIYYLFQNREKGVKLVLWWFLVAPLASAFTKATPHAVRALLYLPTYQIFTTFGIYLVFAQLKKKLGYNRGTILLFVICFLLLVNIFYYLHMYYIHTPKIYASWWQYGYKQAVSHVNELERYYSKVIFTYAYDQPYIYFLFYNQIDPSWYQVNWGGGEVLRDVRNFGKYEFKKIDWGSDSNRQNVLLVGTPKEIPEGVNGIITDIKFPDGSVAFRIVAR